jgi:hypothetical protein
LEASEGAPLAATQGPFHPAEDLAQGLYRRHSAIYKEICKQRMASERGDSQAVELGIEQPKLRNGQAITA